MVLTKEQRKLLGLSEEDKAKMFQVAMGFVGGGTVRASKAFAELGSNVFNSLLKKEALVVGTKQAASTGGASAQDIVKVLSSKAPSNKPFAKALQNFTPLKQDNLQGVVDTLAKELTKGKPPVRPPVNKLAIANTAMGITAAGLVTSISQNLPVTPEEIKSQAASTLHAKANTNSPDTINPKKVLKEILPGALETSRAIGDTTVLEHLQATKIRLGSKSTYKITAKDYLPVVDSARPGQSIYAMSNKAAVALGYPDGKALYMHLPNDKPTDSTLDPQPIEVNAHMTESRKYQLSLDGDIKAISEIRKGHLDTLTKNSVRLQQLHKAYDYSLGFVNKDPQASRDLIKIQKDMDAEHTRLINLADHATAVDPVVQQLQRNHKQRKDAQLSPQVQVVVDNFITQTGINDAAAMSFAVDPSNLKKMATWTAWLQRGIVPKLLDATAPNDITTLATELHHKKLALQAGDNPLIVDKELAGIRLGRNNALATLIHANRAPTAEKAAQIDTFDKLYKDNAQTQVLSILISTALGTSATAHPKDIIARLIAEGNTPEQAKTTIQSKFDGIQLDHMAKELGITPHEFDVRRKLGFKSFYPDPSFLEGAANLAHTAANSMLLGASY